MNDVTQRQIARLARGLEPDRRAELFEAATGRRPPATASLTKVCDEIGRAFAGEADEVPEDLRPSRARRSDDGPSVAERREAVALRMLEAGGCTKRELAAELISEGVGGVARGHLGRIVYNAAERAGKAATTVREGRVVRYVLEDPS